MNTSREAGLAIVMPVYEDWTAVTMLTPLLDEALAGAGRVARVVAVDDGSSHIPAVNLDIHRGGVVSVQVVELGRNVGHQRAIAIGLAWCHDNLPDHDVLVMDADGEDAPSEAMRMVATCHEGGGKHLIFAQRARRSEGPLFRISYVLYKLLFRLATGKSIRFGNFSVVPYPILRKLVRVSEIWNNYAAGIVKSRLPFREIPTARAHRLDGRSHMSFPSLVLHGLSALSVYADVIGVRAVIASGVLSVGLIGVIATVTWIRLFTDLGFPGWASSVVGLSLVLLIQLSMLSSMFAFLILDRRNTGSFLPIREYKHLVLDVRTLAGEPLGSAS